MIKRAPWQFRERQVYFPDMVQSSSDKRRFFRHPLSVPIEYQELQTHKNRSSTVDISEGGLSFISEKAFTKGSALYLRIPVGDQVFKIEGIVAYSYSVSIQSRYRVGVIFRDSSNAFQAKLAEEMLQMKLYQKKISSELGYEIPEEEAARRWIEKYAKQFGELF